MVSHTRQNSEPDNKVHGANMVLSAPDGPHVGPMSFAIWASRFGAGKFVNWAAYTWRWRIDTFFAGDRRTYDRALAWG